MGTFQRKFFNADSDFTYIGSGSLGGKAQGLVRINSIIKEKFDSSLFQEISVSIPRMTVITTELFEEFMRLNHLHDQFDSNTLDERIAHAFQTSHLPPKIAGDLYALISQVKSPLAIRSSSLLEDALYEPFAGIYGTKMTPNNQFDTKTRFAKLVEAIKYVYASTYFKSARDYLQATNHSAEEEKMAVIIQEVVGKRHGDRFYPDISGVARSFNFYPTGHARPEEGIASLALGLGRTIVDDGISWSYSPAYPRSNPPYNSINDLLRQTQKHFWIVNMAKIPQYDPVKETEYLLKLEIDQAEKDETLKFLASTYDPASDRIYPGVSSNGPRLLNFAPVLQMNAIPLNDLIRIVLDLAGESLNNPVEIEFAVTLDTRHGLPARFGFLQVRPMVISHENVEIRATELTDPDNLIASEHVLGNGTMNNIFDVVYVKPEKFDIKFSRDIANEIGQLNQILKTEYRPFLLIGFGRWGSSDPWLGIPANWGQISGARVIVESTLPEINVDLSQGSHFFHNLSSFRISYFSVKHSGKYSIDWDWLDKQTIENETNFVKHIKLSSPLKVKVDGRTGKGIIKK
jgi:hypothetical protein